MSADSVRKPLALAQLRVNSMGQEEETQTNTDLCCDRMTCAMMRISVVIHSHGADLVGVNQLHASLQSTIFFCFFSKEKNRISHYVSSISTLLVSNSNLKDIEDGVLYGH